MAEGVRRGEVRPCGRRFLCSRIHGRCKLVAEGGRARKLAGALLEKPETFQYDASLRIRQPVRVPERTGRKPKQETQGSA